MGPEGFRKLARSMPEAEEREHMDHPDFRVGGKIFATLGRPDEHWAMVKLTPEQQKELTESHPDVFVPVKGAWGRRGCTSVRLNSATPAMAKTALEMACRNIATKNSGRDASKQRR
jgi:hypothetical protein